MFIIGLIFGIIAGLLVSTLMILNIAVMPEEVGGGSEAAGYLSMLIALSMIFFAIKRYRDEVLGGVIKFWPALLLGVGVTAVASVFYVVSWEIYFNATGGAWAETYLNDMVEAHRATGVSEEELAAYTAQMQEMMAMYANWWFRVPVTLMEILPVGILVGVISAALLRNPNILPKRA